MHLLLTDRLACPRCGPAFGLILLADRIEDRRVLQGVLGCPNCRERYPVHGGFGDFRPPPRGPLPRADGTPGRIPEAPPEDETMRIAALFGISEGPGNLLLTGSLVMHGLALSRLIEEIEVVAVDPALRHLEEQAGMSRIVAGGSLPFYSGMFRGVGIGADSSEKYLGEGIRILARLGRLVVFDAGEETVRRVEAAGLTPLAHEEGVLVATRK